jgi:hypothetical protein
MVVDLDAAYASEPTAVCAPAFLADTAQSTTSRKGSRELRIVALAPRPHIAERLRATPVRMCHWIGGARPAAVHLCENS